MPDIKVYIRTENLEKWKSIPNKSEWINTLLSNSDDTSRYGSARQTPVGPVVEVLSETVPPLQRACCLLKKPCIHWQYDDVMQTWTNVLTGEVKVLE
jgi:hypothetical protein